MITYVNKRVCEYENIEIIELPDCNDSSTSSSISIETLCVQVKIQHKNDKVHNRLIVNVYRSPKINKTIALKQVDELLLKLDKHSHKHVFLAGDFNFNLLNYGHDSASQSLIDSMHSHGYSQLISKPTRITEHSVTLIDHIYSNKVHEISNTGIISYDISDHLATYACISLGDKLNQRVEYENKQRELTKFSEANMSKFKELIENEDWDDVLTETDTQCKYNKFIDTYNSHYNTAFVTQTQARRKFQRTNPKPWILPWLEEACDRKNKAYLDYVQEKDAQEKIKLKENMIKRIGLYASTLIKQKVGTTKTILKSTALVHANNGK